MSSVVGLDEKMPFAVREVGALPRGIGSDHDTFLGAGVPGFFWNQAGKANYNRIHHTQYDTYDGANPEYQKHSALVVALGAYGVASLDHMLSREGMTSATATVSNRRLLGIQLEELKIVEVVEDGLGAKAGFKVGDVLMKVGDKAVTTRGEFTTELQAGDPSKKITVKRDDKEVEIPVTFPAPPKP
jgi:C-terminal processing protease CtpA/Prc